MKHTHIQPQHGHRRQQHTRRQRRSRQRQQRRRTAIQQFVRQRRRRRDTAGVVNDVARLEMAGATSRRSRRQRPSRHGGVVGAPGPSRRCRRTTRRCWSAPNHGVSTTVDRRQLTTRCRFSSGHALRSSSSLSRFTQRTSVLNSD